MDDGDRDEPGRTDDRRSARCAALTISGAGVAAFVAGFAFKSRALRIAGLAATAAGGAFYARERLAARGRRIAEAESSIRSTLDDLDPVAKAQVIKDMTQDLLGG